MALEGVAAAQRHQGVPVATLIYGVTAAKVANMANMPDADN